ncbi:MAG: hypothetical protein HYX92_00915 [Chloroflexi bacterium]|nr:hypothetical protein [Chloroflexota bacterium]
MLGDALPEAACHRVDLTAQTTDVLAEVLRQVPNPRGSLLIVNLETAVPSDRLHHEIVTVLNLQRPEWPQRARQPVVFWLPHYVLGFLEREAPDFFDWRSDTIVFPEMEEQEADYFRRFAWTPAAEASLSKETRFARIRELRARLKKAPRSQDPVAQAARAGWLVELACQMVFVGEKVDQALHLLQRAVELYDELGDKRSRAVTLGDIARIRAAKGEVDAALEGGSC